MPRITSESRTGMVMRSSRVPEPFSAASDFMVTAGMTKRLISGGRYTNIWSIVARSISQKLPGKKPACGMRKNRMPSKSTVPPRTT